MSDSTHDDPRCISPPLPVRHETIAQALACPQLKDILLKQNRSQSDGKKRRRSAFLDLGCGDGRVLGAVSKIMQKSSNLSQSKESEFKLFDLLIGLDICLEALETSRTYLKVIEGLNVETESDIFQDLNESDDYQNFDSSILDDIDCLIVNQDIMDVEKLFGNIQDESQPITESESNKSTFN